ncbi:hypothetical protein COL5a_004078 [Colletotrichum fioriniae]|uniref:uncharacterized protein n=1 Tax=Colletotrichum fioriniae TaxID=710243 RepID=UPI0032D9BBE3|nr:hypothetical protein COL5a_004078 [Colletotrichum fioriniae]KAJ3948454.1 hypothetical protein N0V96_002705 [Colletotrichum fioriniae]
MSASDFTWRQRHLAAWLRSDSYTAQYNPDSNITCLDDRSSSASYHDGTQHDVTADCDTNFFVR